MLAENENGMARSPIFISVWAMERNSVNNQNFLRRC